MTDPLRSVEWVLGVESQLVIQGYHSCLLSLMKEAILEDPLKFVGLQFNEDDKLTMKPFFGLGNKGLIFREKFVEI